ncbi:MAG: GNAT family N-acetyltransferase [Chloroflexota bacterium]|nr:GNAT family N-acetyltransferase [Chloroflexota bacterium]
MSGDAVMAADRPPAGERSLPMLRGERVFLRASERSDIPLFVRWFNDAETASFLSQRAPLSVPLEEGWFERMLAGQGREGYHFVICRIDDDQPIGTVGLFALDHINGSAGMGISIGEKSLWGQGYGTDALNALTDFAFGELRLERVWLDVYEFNSRARRSYEKCGFVLEGTKRSAFFRRGRFVDIHLMSILRREWEQLDRRRSWDYEAV